MAAKFKGRAKKVFFLTPALTCRPYWNAKTLVVSQLGIIRACIASRPSHLLAYPTRRWHDDFSVTNVRWHLFASATAWLLKIPHHLRKFRHFLNFGGPCKTKDKGTGMWWGDVFIQVGKKVSYDIFMAQGERVVGLKEGISSTTYGHQFNMRSPCLLEGTTRKKQAKTITYQ